MSGASPVQHVTTVTSSSTDGGQNKRNRRWSLMQVALSSLVGVSGFALVSCSYNAQPIGVKMATKISCLI